MEVWEKVLVDADGLSEDVHGFIPCTDCHGGQDVAGEDMDAKYTAHEGLVRDPSVDANAACGTCHVDVAPVNAESLHYSLTGYDTRLYERSSPENHPLIEEGESYHCNNCHATCGQCHVSQPTSVGGGLISGHVYEETPSMSRQCTACHGSRVKNEYTGANEGYPADVHLRSARMVCTDCHDAADMHGTGHVADGGEMNDHRYDGDQSPACEDCHEDQAGVGTGNPYHDAHGTEVLSCQTCHSVSYINCWDCHLERTDDEWDLAYFLLGHEEMGFYIGKNAERSAERPYRYVPVRHVPTFPELFDLYGENILDNFDALPTWTYSTPHNIQRNTPQTESCESCHGNDEYFLTPDKVDEDELIANQEVIVPFAPPLPETYAFDPDAAQPGTGDDPLDTPSGSGDPLDAPAGSGDPLDAPAGSGDPLDAPAGGGDPLDAPAQPTATADPLDA